MNLAKEGLAMTINSNWIQWQCTELLIAMQKAQIVYCYGDSILWHHQSEGGECATSGSGSSIYIRWHK